MTIGFTRSVPSGRAIGLALMGAAAVGCDAHSTIELFPERSAAVSEARAGGPGLGPSGDPSESTEPSGFGGLSNGVARDAGAVAGSGGAPDVPATAGAGGTANVGGSSTMGGSGGTRGAEGGAAGEPSDAGVGGSQDPGSFAVEPVHRYRFEGTGVVAEDDVSGADATVEGGATLAGGEVVLDGNDDYVDLPNGIVSVLAEATFSAWLVWNGNNCWHRVWSFGTTVQGEDLVGDRENELFATPVNCPGAADAEGYTALVEFAGAPNENAELLSGVPFGNGILRHAVLSFGASGALRLYLDGERVAVTTTGWRLADIADVNNWLGRSQWTQDYNLPGVYESFEIYDVALSDAEVRDLFASGPR